ncbi:MAG: YceI family protein [Cyclobacteriaceae bacterium]|nr:YceI family protein [Cyclobacteriaceae bacterium]
MKYIFTLVCAVFSLAVYAQHYNLANTSTISINGTSTLHNWSVNAEKMEGSLLIDTKKNTNNYIKKGVISLANLIIPVSSLHSEKGETMDNKMYRALKIDEYPEIFFTLKIPVQFENINETQRILNIAGTINIAGVKKIITTQTMTYLTSGIVTFSGKVPLKLSDFDIEPPTAMFGQIETGNDIVVNYKFQFKQSD